MQKWGCSKVIGSGELAKNIINTGEKIKEGSNEIKNPNTENFKNIKPQEGMTKKEADDYWNIKFDDNKDIDTTKSESDFNERTEEMKSDSAERTDEMTPDAAERTGEMKSEPEEVKGGSYRDTKRTSDGETHEVHHTPSDEAAELGKDGPAIKMEKEDHHKTASYGNSKEAREYRAQQKELIDQGKFREAVQMDIDDIRSKFGDKYDEGISQMKDYVDQLEKEGKING